LGTVFTPFLVNGTVPSSFSTGHQAEFSRSSAFWAACYAHNVANLKWNYAVKDLERRQSALESASIDLVSDLQSKYRAESNWDVVQSAIADNAAKIVDSLWSLSDEIVFKYASGFVNEHGGKMSQMVGYPKWWLDAVGYAEGPPPPPTKPKCCHPPKIGSNGTKPGRMYSLSNTRLTGKAAMRQFLRQNDQGEAA